MTSPPSQLLTRACIVDAVARQLRADLILRPVTPVTDTRLISRFLALGERDLVVLAVPRSHAGKKVFVPAGWSVGLSFELAGLWIQTSTAVAGHGPFAVHAAHRVDALLLHMPDRILSCNRRRSKRRRADSGQPVAVTIWGLDGETVQSPPASGALLNWSDGGLGVRLSAPLPASPGSPVLARLAPLAGGEGRILRGTIKHCTPCDNGQCLVGLGELVEISPGQAPALMDVLTRPLSAAKPATR